MRLMHAWRPRAGRGLRAVEKPDGTTLEVVGSLMPPTPWKVTLGSGFLLVRPGLCKGVEATVQDGSLLALEGGPRQIPLQADRPLVGLRCRFIGSQLQGVVVTQIRSLEDLGRGEAWRTIALLKGPPSNPSGSPVRVVQVVWHHQDFTATGDLEGWRNVRFFWRAVP